MSMLSRFATTGGGGDPYWANVSYLLVGNGTGGTTTNIKDSSSNNLTTNINPTVVISTTNNKFGSGSVYFNGTNGYLSVPNTSLLKFGSGDFTIEFWYRPTATKNLGIIGDWSSVGRQFIVANLNGKLVTAFNDSTIIITSSTGFTLNAWEYYTAVRSGSTITIYRNGVANGSASVSGALTTSAGSMYIGTNGEGIPSWNYPGYIYDLRITKGIARYTSNFTPPTSPLPIG